MPSLPTRHIAVPRVALLVALLTLSVAIVGSLAYEAHDASRSHRVTAERALRDYASVAGWEYVANVQERVEAAVTEVLSPVTSVRASSPYELLAPPEMLTSQGRDVLACERARGDSARVVFRVDLRDGTVATGGTPADSALTSWLRDTVTTHMRSRYRPETRYAALADPAHAPGRIIFYAVRYAQHGAPLAAYGFTSCPRAIGDGVLREAMAVHALLPSSVTGGAPNDSLVEITVRDAAGRIWFASAQEPRPADGALPSYAGEVALDGVGAPLVVYAALRPGAPERLLVGVPPASRLPILLGLLGLTAALAAIAFIQLRREHELARLRADFTSSVSHELRTPLAQILLFGETLELDRVRTDADRRLAITTIVAEARRLMRMVDNVLHFSRTSEGRLQLECEPTDLGPLVSSIVANFAPLAEERGARVVLEVREPVRPTVDAGAVRQIVLNLLDNALKFGPQGQTVRVTVDRAGDVAMIAVQDQGLGIPAGDRERVWSPYVRLRRGRSAAHEGSGIGLAVVRELVLLHGGTARVEDAASGGARFIVELPIDRRMHAPASARARPTPPGDDARDRQRWIPRRRSPARRIGTHRDRA